MMMRLLLLSFLIIGLLSAESVTAYSQEPSIVVVTIDGEAVTQKELSYWQRRYRLPDLLQHQQSEAFSELKRYKLILKLAREYDLVRDVSYAAMLKNRVEVNKSRQKMKAEGRVIYGPVTYSQDVYMDFITSNLEIKLRAALKRENPVEDVALLQKQYNDNIRHYKKADTIHVESLTFPVLSNEAVQQIIQTWNDTKQIDVSALGEEQAKRQDWHFSEDRPISEGELDAPFFQAVQTIKQGEVIKVDENGDAVTLVFCHARQDGDNHSFERVKSQVQRLYEQQRYEIFMQKMVDNAVVVMP